MITLEDIQNKPIVFIFVIERLILSVSTRSFASTGNFNKMVSKLCLNRTVDFSDFFGKYNLIKFFDHLA